MGRREREGVESADWGFYMYVCVHIMCKINIGALQSSGMGYMYIGRTVCLSHHKSAQKGKAVPGKGQVSQVVSRMWRAVPGGAAVGERDTDLPHDTTQNK